MTKMVVKKQKIIKVGNSLAVTLDRKFVNEHALSAGQVLTASRLIGSGMISLGLPEVVEAVGSQDKIKKSQRKALVATKVDKSFREWVDKSLDEDAEAMKRLADL